MSIQGLAKQEVEAQRRKYGYNEIIEYSTKWHTRLVKKLLGPIPIMIEVAAILSAVVAQWEDFFIILALLLVNVGVDFLQENEAVNALEALKKKLAQKALVYRNGVLQSIEARLLVPGDVIKLEIGDIVPADVRLLSGSYLEVDQSTLTGESLPVLKEVGNEVYGNAIVRRGTMLAEVTAIGMSTYFGKTASYVDKAGKLKVSHFQRAVTHIGKFLIAITTVLAICILLIALYRSDPLLETLHFILVLVIASIPVALPAVLSVTMAVGAVAISKHNAIVRNISAIEELAGVDVLCSDKTGTLTQNKMTLQEPVVYYDFSPQDVCAFAVLASQKENKDPLEHAIFEYYNDNFSNDYFEPFSIHEYTPFDPVKKHTSATGTRGDEAIVILKGAPQVVLEKIVDISLQKQAKKDVETLAQKGFRTLAVAARFNNDPYYSLVGILPMYDPPRTDSKEVITKIRKAGVQVKMLTGDNKAIAKQIAEMLGIGLNVIDTKELKTGDAFREFALLGNIVAKSVYKKLNGFVTEEEVEEFGNQIAFEVKNQMREIQLHKGFIKKHESDIIELIENTDSFSEVLPEDKYLIVDKLQKNDHIVAMTGDGVNDAPALKKADIGIAVSGATDAARSAADLVLLSSGLQVINDAIRIARMTFERMRGYATFRIAETIRIILFMSLSIIFFNFYPVTALMIIILALLNDIPVLMIAYDNAPVDDDVVRWDMREVLTISSILGITGVISSFLLFYWLLSQSYSLALIQAILFLKLDLAGHSTLYLTRTGKNHFWHKPFPSLKFFLPAFTTRIIGTLLAVYGIFMEPVGWKIACYIWIYALLWWIFNDYVKVYAYRVLTHHKKIKMKYVSS